MSYETILVEQSEGIVTLTMNRPERLNAWTYQMGDELTAAIAQGNADDSVVAFVLTGAGPVSYTHLTLPTIYSV